MSILAFDIETVPDVEAGRCLYELSDLDDAGVIRAMRQLRRQKVGHDFLPLHLHRVIAISVVHESEGVPIVRSLGGVGSSEEELVHQFFRGLEHYRPTLVSWNGSGFDLPVLNYRALVHGIDASAYWETGEEIQNYRYNNYVSRYHWRHVDLMDVMAHFQSRGAAPLDDIAKILGFPGKSGMHGSEVADAWLSGKLEDIRHYCDTDALNTYLVWLRFELIRGHLDGPSYRERMLDLRKALASDPRTHLSEFAGRWVME